MNRKSDMFALDVFDGQPLSSARGTRRVWVLLLIVGLTLLALALTLANVRDYVAARVSPEVPADFGDAPDSLANHYGISNTAYASPKVYGRFSG